MFRDVERLLLHKYNSANTFTFIFHSKCEKIMQASSWCTLYYTDISVPFKPVLNSSSKIFICPKRGKNGSNIDANTLATCTWLFKSIQLSWGLHTDN